jgi:hypothetical protein
LESSTSVNTSSLSYPISDPASETISSSSYSFTDSASGLGNLDYNKLRRDGVKKGIRQARDISDTKRITSLVNALSAPPLAHRPFTQKQLNLSFTLLEAELFKTPSPIDIEAFAELTVDYPNQPLRNSLIRLFTVGSSGNIRDLDRPLTFYKNHGSAVKAFEVVTKNIETELNNGHRSVISQEVLDLLQYGTSNPIGVVHQKGKSRIINDLSYPKGTGESVNDHIDNLEYGILVLDTVSLLAADLRRIISEGGERTYVMGDAKAYYRNLPRQPRDQVHQLIHFDGETMIDHVESFGDRGAPSRCCLFGDVFSWILKYKYGIKDPTHYVDNWIILSDKETALVDNIAFKSCCDKIGLPMNKKDEYVGQTPLALGFRINGAAGTISIPVETRLGLARDIHGFLRKGELTFKELRSIVGKCVWACAVAPLGFVYAHKALLQVEAMKNESSSFVVNLGSSRFSNTKSALTWFSELFIQWCGVAVYREIRWENASSFFGCSGDASPVGGAFTTPSNYSFWTWCKCGCADTKNTMRLELATILISLATRMASLFTGKLVIQLSDSSSGVTAFNKGYADDPISSAIIAEARQILIGSQTDNYRLMWTGRENISHADSLTRGGVTEFLKKVEQRKFCDPHSTRTVKLLPRAAGEPYVFGFSSHH